MSEKTDNAEPQAEEFTPVVLEAKLTEAWLQEYLKGLLSLFTPLAGWSDCEPSRVGYEAIMILLERLYALDIEQEEKDLALADFLAGTSLAVSDFCNRKALSEVEPDGKLH